MVTMADILVIGGGIAGIGAAARLAPDANVIVLEREAAIGTHSTGRSAAVYIRNYGNATLKALTTASLPVYESREFSDMPLLTPRGELSVAGEADLDALDQAFAEGIGLERLTPAEAVSLVPILRQYKIAGAALEADAQDIDVDSLLQGYVSALRRAGGKIETGVTIRSIAREREAVWRVDADGETFEAPILINAAGAWSDVVAQLAGVEQIGLVPMRRSAAILPAPDYDGFDKWPVVGSIDESWYCKPQSGKLLVSPAEEDPVEPQDAWPDDMVLAEGLDRFEQATTYELTRVERSWAGLRSFVADRTPVVGFAPDADGFFWLAGQGGYGIQTSPAMAQLTADLIFKRATVVSADIIKAIEPGRSTIGPKASFG